MSLTRTKSVVVGINTKTYQSKVTIPANFSGMISGPITVPDIDVNGTLNCIGDLNVTGNTNIGSAGSLNVTN